jgi:hypothetical protein
VFVFPSAGVRAAPGGNVGRKSSVISSHLPPRGTSRAAITAPPRNSDLEPQLRSNTEMAIPRNIPGSNPSFRSDTESFSVSVFCGEPSPHRTKNRLVRAFHVGFKVIFATLVLYLCFLSAPNAPTSTNGSE